MQRKDSQKIFEGQSVYVGIDYHKKSWKVSIYGEQYEHKTMSRAPDAEQLLRYLEKNFPGAAYHAVYEAGFSGFGSCRRLRDLGVNCMVINPADVPTSQKEKLQKTDKADSRKLARSLRSGALSGIHIPDRQLEADRGLVRQRFRIVKDIARNKNRVKSLLFQFGISMAERFTTAQTRYWSRPYTDWLLSLSGADPMVGPLIDNYVRIVNNLRKELLGINRQVRELSRTSRYKDSYNLLVTVPGIGLMSAMAFLTQLGDFTRFKRLDELCNYVGLVPRMYGSGDKMVVGKLINRGRKELKIMLIEASWVAIRQDPALMAKFNELIKTMPKNKAIIRIARKLLNRIRYVIVHRKEYVTGVVS
ncbi:IS110 family RNA-guided transposase [Echinicola rosea]|uniref:IS110 family transposase n=1 Tax=Echinicola rosea TaxID=1807691 RepID=UPI0010CA6E5E|nr:IS110 family transposase [Echinicola rosea]